VFSCDNLTMLVRQISLENLDLSVFLL
jgi:hypothetical protein